MVANQSTNLERLGSRARTAAGVGVGVGVGVGDGVGVITETDFDESDEKQLLESAEKSCRFDYGSCFAPRFCRVFNRPIWMLIFWCVASFAQSGFMNGSANAVLTTLEKRYQLTSTEVGFIVSVNDVIMILVVSFVSYYGGRGRKPRWIAYGCLSLGLGSLIFALPQAIFGRYEYMAEVESEPICELPANSTSAQCNKTGGGNSIIFYVFVLAQVLAGVGSTPLYTIGITYLDDNAGPSKSAMYVGVFMTMWVVGPAAGFLLTYASLNLYVDFPSEPSMSSDSGLWVGAWWLPFIFFGVLLIVFAFVPILGYPTELPQTKIRNMKGQKRTDSSNVHAGFSGDRYTLTKALKAVVTNKVFWLLSFGTACNSFTSSIFATFGPKLLQDMFGVDTASAAFYFGIVIVPGAGIGTLIGGYILKRYNLTIKQILIWMSAVAMATVPPLFCFLLACPRTVTAGLYDYYPSVNSSWQNSTWVDPLPLDGPPALSAACNANCSCSFDEFLPICGSDGVQYYSPCFAGCRAYENAEQKVYLQCDCIQPPASRLSEMVKGDKFKEELALKSNSFALAGRCSTASWQECPSLPIFLALLFIVALLQFTATVPIIQVIIRCMPDYCSSVALGVNSLVFRALGVIPGPIIGGAVFDIFCKFWQRIGCFRDDSCLAYDMKSVRIALLCVCVIMHLLQVVFYSLTYVLFKPPQSESDSTSRPVELEVTALASDSLPDGVSTASDESAEA